MLNTIVERVCGVYEEAKPRLTDYSFVMSGFHFVCEDDSHTQWEVIQDYLLDEEEAELEKGSTRIVHLRDDALYEQIESIKRADAAFEVIETYKDGVCHREYKMKRDGVACVLYLPEFEDRYAILRLDRQNFIVVTTSVTKNRETHPLRVVREIIFRESENDGYVMIHGAAVNLGEHGALICGDKAAGKTTLMLGLAMNGARYVANDRVLVKCTEARGQMISLPLATRIGKGTLSQLDRLQDCLATYAWARPQVAGIRDFDSNALDAEQEYGSNKKLELVPRELHELLDIRMCGQSNLTALIFPQFSLLENEFVVEELSKEAAYELLLSQCMTPLDESWVNPWFVERQLPAQVLEEQAHATLKRLVDELPAWRVGYGRSFLQGLKEGTVNWRMLFEGKEAFSW